MGSQVQIDGRVVSGHGVASGQSGDPRFPEGTLALQWPAFLAAGVELEGIHRGTINVSIAPLVPEPVLPLHQFSNLKWHPDCAAEDFAFFDIGFSIGDAEPVAAYIYRPDPATKPEHFQDLHVLEVLAPKLAGITAGAVVHLFVDPKRMGFRE